MFYNRHRSTAWKLDRICAANTGFKTFDELIFEVNESYAPSIDTTNLDLAYLADHYDRTMEVLGEERRAFRFGRYNR